MTLQSKREAPASEFPKQGLLFIFAYFFPCYSLRIFPAYGRMVRPLENLPAFAIFSRHFRENDKRSQYPGLPRTFSPGNRVDHRADGTGTAYASLLLPAVRKTARGTCRFRRRQRCRCHNGRGGWKRALKHRSLSYRIHPFSIRIGYRFQTEFSSPGICRTLDRQLFYTGCRHSP